MKWHIFGVLVVCFLSVGQGLDAVPSATHNGLEVRDQIAGETASTIPPQETIEELAMRIEKRMKGFIKEGVKLLMSRIVTIGHAPTLSSKCIRSLMKLIADLTKVRMWSLKMLDASSKLPPGIFEGTFTDYGSFDECLDIVVPLRNGSEDFRGRYCAIRMAPRLPPIPKNFSVSKWKKAKPFDTIATQFILSSYSFHYLSFRFGICIPSSCTKEDIIKIVPNVVNMSTTMVDVQKCYVKEPVKFEPIHIAVICVLVVLVILVFCGTVVENLKTDSKNMDQSGLWRVILAFSLISNSRRLMVTSKSNSELKALHGIRALSMAWVIMGHTYIWTSFARSSRFSNGKVWFNDFAFQSVLNSWLAVELFFFLSGLLTCYATLQLMEKSKGRLNVPLFIVHRYLRLTPSLVMTMGLVFFLPLISSGPFWHEHVDTELEACRKNWWMNFLYISNWMPMTKVCIHTMWYLAADFQMYIFSPLVILLLYRSALSGLTALAVLTVACNILVGALTHMYELTPTVLLSTANTQLISDELDLIHIRTYTHVGSYCVGMATGYLILKKKNSLHLSKWQNILGWSASIFLSASSSYGIHRWSTGDFHGPLLTSVYAAMHRTAFIMGVAWVVIACVTGNGGPVNWILSRKVWVPFSKLTYMAYLMHGLVLWTRFGSIRERFYLSHYNVIYEYFSTVVIVVAVSFLLYLLVDAPLDNLQRLLFARSPSTKENVGKKDLRDTDTSSWSPTINGNLTSSTVELTSVKPSSNPGEYQNGFLNHVVTEIK